MSALQQTPSTNPGQGTTDPYGNPGPSTPGAPGIGVPAGGTTGQALVKNSNTNYDTKWLTVADGGTNLGWFDVEAYGAVTNTESTVAIQAAIDAAGAAGGGVVWFPHPPYVVGGALVDTTRSNCQLRLPSVDVITGVPITIVFKGPAPGPQMPCIPPVGSVPLVVPTIKSTLTTGSGTTPSCIGGWGPPLSAGDFTMVNAVLDDFTLQMPVDPQLSAFNFSYAAAFECKGSYANAGSEYVPGIAIQTTSTSYALLTPHNGNGARINIVSFGGVGFYNGMSVNEHTQVHDLQFFACKRGLVYLAGDHSSWIGRVMIAHCQTPVTFTGIHYFTIGDLNIEHAAGGTWNPSNDVDDPSNFGHGDLKWSVVKESVGQSTSFLVNGASGILYNRLGATPGTLATHGFRAYQTAGSLTTLSSGGVAKIQLTAKTFDASTEFDNAVNFRFTPTLSGYYQVNGIVAYQDGAGTVTGGQAIIYKNGASYANGSYAQPNGGGVWSNVSDMVFMNGTTDYLELFAYGVCSTPPLKAQAGSDFTAFSAILISR